MSKLFLLLVVSAVVVCALAETVQTDQETAEQYYSGYGGGYSPYNGYGGGYGGGRPHGGYGGRPHGGYGGRPYGSYNSYGGAYNSYGGRPYGGYGYGGRPGIGFSISLGK